MNDVRPPRAQSIVHLDSKKNENNTQKGSRQNTTGIIGAECSALFALVASRGSHKSCFRFLHRSALIDPLYNLPLVK